MPNPGNDSNTLPSGLSEVVGCDETVARFLTTKSQFNSFGPKLSAFLPTKDPVETSVTRHIGEPAEELWKLAEPLCVSIGRDVKGAALVLAEKVNESGLSVEADEPPDRHAAIRGWPINNQDPEAEKAERKERALLLADHAVMKRK